MKECQKFRKLKKNFTCTEQVSMFAYSEKKSVVVDFVS